MVLFCWILVLYPWPALSFWRHCAEFPPSVCLRFLTKTLFSWPAEIPKLSVCRNKRCSRGPEIARIACLCYLSLVLCATRALSDTFTLIAWPGRSFCHVFSHYLWAWKPQRAQISHKLELDLQTTPSILARSFPHARFDANWGQIQQKLRKLLKSWVWSEWVGGDKGFVISSNSQPPPHAWALLWLSSLKNILNSRQPTQWHFCKK